MKRLSLRKRIVLLSVVLTIFIAEIFSVFYYRNMSRDLERNLRDYSNSLAFQVSQYFNDRQHTFVTRIYAFISSDRFQTAIFEYLQSSFPYQYSLALSNYNALVGEIRLSDTFYGAAYLYTPRGTFYDLTRYYGNEPDFTASLLYDEYLKEGAPRVYYGYQRMDTVFNSGRMVVPVVIRLPVEGYLDDVFLVIHMDGFVLEEYLTRSTMQGVDVLIVTPDGKLVGSGNPLKTKEYLDSIEICEDRVTSKNENYIISANQLDVNDWYVISFSDKAIIRETMKTSLLLIMLLHVAALLIVLLGSSILSGVIVKPLRELQKYMYRFTEGEYNLHYTYTDDNEVGHLAEGFNNMVRRIGDLVGELSTTIAQLQVEKENVRQEQSLKRAAEMNALQAQIDPHLLHNALNAIVWLAAEDETAKISGMATSLSKFYEYRIRGGALLPPLREEIEQIKNYVAIQNIRYGDTIQCDYVLDPTLLEVKVLKLVLQPLVENSIIHGLQCRDDAAHICVHAHRDINDPEAVLIDVEDDGMGIPPEKLDTMNLYLKIAHIPDEGYGIYNVNKRIKLYFGERSGLFYESHMGKGTVAHLRYYPIADVDGEEVEHVSNDGGG